MVHNPVNTFISFALLVSVVGGSFFYVYSGGPVELPAEPWMGITDGLFLTPARADALGLSQEHGLLIFIIAPASPADEAGLRGANNVTVIEGQQVPVGGDIVVSIDDRPINSPEDVCAVLAQRQVGDSIVFVVDRNGDVEEVDVTLEELPPQARSTC